jgi:hypothetical protein
MAESREIDRFLKNNAVAFAVLCMAPSLIPCINKVQMNQRLLGSRCPRRFCWMLVAGDYVGMLTQFKSGWDGKGFAGVVRPWNGEYSLGDS